MLSDRRQPDPVVDDDGTAEPVSQLTDQVEPHPGREDHGGDHVSRAIDDAGKRDPDRAQLPGVEAGEGIAQLPDDHVELLRRAERRVNALAGGGDHGGSREISHHHAQAIDADVDARHQAAGRVEREMTGRTASPMGPAWHTDDQVVAFQDSEGILHRGAGKAEVAGQSGDPGWLGVAQPCGSPDRSRRLHRCSFQASQYLRTGAGTHNIITPV